MARSHSWKSRLAVPIVIAVLAVATALGVASCGSSSDDAADESPSAAGSPKAGGTLRVVWYEEPQSLDPIVPSDNQSIWTIANLFEQLVRVNADGSGIEPGLAESWDVSTDGAHVHVPPEGRGQVLRRRHL